jgi:hypothetical protein
MYLFHPKACYLPSTRAWGCCPSTQITCEYNGLSLQQWYQVYEGVLSFSFVFFVKDKTVAETS